MTTPQPTLAGFQAFITNVMKIKPADLPTSSPWIGIALANAMAIVNPSLACVGIPTADAADVSLGTTWGTLYTEAVYNLAADNLINYAPDQPGRSYFKRLRKQLNINGFVSGVVQSSSDESTSVGLVVQDAARAFTLANLQNLKTTYGRAYLALAQSTGPNVYGMS